MLPNCDCGACCETCGHDPGCIRDELLHDELLHDEALTDE